MELSQHPAVSVVCMYELSMYQQQWDILTHRIMVGQYGAYLRLIDLLLLCSPATHVKECNYRRYVLTSQLLLDTSSTMYDER